MSFRIFGVIALLYRLIDSISWLLGKKECRYYKGKEIVRRKSEGQKVKSEAKKTGAKS